MLGEFSFFILFLFLIQWTISLVMVFTIYFKIIFNALILSNKVVISLPYTQHKHLVVVLQIISVFAVKSGSHITVNQVLSVDNEKLAPGK